MKIIDMIMEHDTINCYEDMEQDEVLQEFEEKFYDLIEACPKETKKGLELVFSRYMARVIRIAYLKGMKDFTDLHVTLKRDVRDFIDEI